MLVSEEILNNSIETGIHQKRTLAFINHFVTKTIEFMNNFATQCEMKLMNFETKMQQVEASLIILETKLASVPSLNELNVKMDTTKDIKVEEPVYLPIIEDIPQLPDESQTAAEEEKPHKDPKYERYYKMLQFGVPLEAVKLKMIQEGMDPKAIE